MSFRSFFFFAVALVISASAAAHSFSAGDLRIGHPFARGTAPGQPTGAAYMTIENSGKEADRLTAVASPIAKAAELHSMTMDGNVMKMRAVDHIDIKPAETISLKPGAPYHVMLFDLRQQLKSGDKFPLTLTFEKAGKVEVTVVVQEKDKDAAASAPAHKH